MITLDVNVYISALEFGGNPLRLLHRAIDGEYQIAISPPILADVVRILGDKFGRSAEELAEVEVFLRRFTHPVSPTETLNVIVEDPDDDRILECAVASNSDLIVTGDKDLLRRREYAGISIVTVSELLNLEQRSAGPFC